MWRKTDSVNGYSGNWWSLYIFLGSLHGAHWNERPRAATAASIDLVVATAGGVEPARRQAIHVHDASVVLQIGPRARRSAAPPEARVHVNGEQAVGDGVQAGVEEAEYEEHVGERVGDGLLHPLGEEPVPQAQQVVRSPADDERRHDHDAHLQGPHASLGDVVVGAAQVDVPRQHCENKPRVCRLQPG